MLGIKKFFINFLAAMMVSDSAKYDDDKGAPLAPAGIQHNIKKQAEREALKKIMDRIETCYGEEFIDLRPGKFEMTKEERTQFFKDNKKKIKSGMLIVIRSDADWEKVYGKKRHLFYDQGKVPEPMVDHTQTLSKKQIRTIANALQKTRRQKSNPDS
jgi:hypothetical protein